MLPSTSNRREEDEGGGVTVRGSARNLSKFPKMVFLLVNLLLYSGVCQGLDVSFDDPSSGFFLRDASPSLLASTLTTTTTAVTNQSDDDNLNIDDDKLKATPTTSIVLGGGQDDSAKNSAANQLTDILHSASFTVLRSTQPVTVTAHYGPFRSRQTVPTQYLVPDLSEEPGQDGSNKQIDEKVSRQPGFITDFKPHQLDLSAHLVTKSIPKDNPVLRVLFHTGQRRGSGTANSRSRADPFYRSSQATICAILYTTLERQPISRQNGTFYMDSIRTLSSTCSPDGRDGTCLGHITLPAMWWPSMTHSIKAEQVKSTMKQPKVNIKISYSVYETKGQSCHVDPALRVSIIPETQLGTVPLVFPQRGYRQLAKDEIIHMLLPQAPIYPNSRIYVPVFLEQPRANDRGPISALTIKCRTRGGFRLEGVETTSRLWTVRAELNGRGTIATVNAFKKNLQTTQGNQPAEKEEESVEDVEGPHELFNWLFALDDRDYELWDKGKISWHFRYQRAAARTTRPAEKMLADQPVDPEKQIDDEDMDVLTEDFFDKDRYRLGAKLSIQKDDVQAVIPITKHSEIMNLAALTGKQISKSLKVFIVSHAGEVADVTLNSQCTSKDQSVLKVSSSCTSVYVDGSETRGAIAAQIDVKYGQQVGRAVFTLWMPEMPVTVDVADPRLSQIKGWKIPAEVTTNRDDSSNSERQRRKVAQMDKTNKTQESSASNPEGTCSIRYQQTRVSVFTKFLAEDPDSGRKEYFPSRGYELDITELVLGHGLRVADPRIASLRGNILQGLAPGRTEIQVVSPITGQEIGVREIKVTKSKEQIREMRVRVLSGLNLKVQMDQIGQRGRYSVQTAYSQILTSKYQEGLLDIELVLTDDTTIPLREVSPTEYYLGVKSLEPRVIAFAPSQEARYPRVIAVSSGQGKLLRVSLELVDACMETSSSDVPLAVADAQVSVKIQNQKKDPINDWDLKKTLDSDMAIEKDADGLTNIALQDDQSYYGKPVLSNGRFDTGTRTSVSLGRDRFASQRIHPHQMTPLEIGMYILLAVFCAAMAIFVASCFVYASKYRRQDYPLQTKSQSVQNAHDWVWLGKANSAKQSVEGSQMRLSHEASEMNITTNPRPDDFEIEECPQLREPMIGTNSNSTRSRQRTMASGHLPPPGHPAHGAPPFQMAPPELIRYGPYQRSHRYHQQMLMHRPQRFLPAPPVHQRLSPVYQNSRKSVEHLEMLQFQNKTRSLEANQHEEEVGMHDYPQEMVQSYHETTNIIHNPMENENYLEELPNTNEEMMMRKEIDTSTYTKKSRDLAYFDTTEHDRGRLILPVGYPYFRDEGHRSNEETETAVDTSPDGAEEQHYFENQYRMRLDDLDILPDPSEFEMDPAVPLRQSPASVLPPVSIEDQEESCQALISPRGEYIPLNPDIDRPSPPRQGSTRVFENPFELSDEESHPVTPEKLSPSHVFESSTMEEEILQQQTALQNESKPVFDSRTFVVKKTPSPTTPPGPGFPTESPKEQKSPQGLWSKDVEVDSEEKEKDDEEMEAAGMDYDNLMAYFESLKESTA